MATVYMAVTGNGQISTSPDGVTWTKSGTTVTDPTQGPLIWNFDDNSFMCVDNTNSFLRRIDAGAASVNTFALPNKATVFSSNIGSLAYNSANKTIVVGGTDQQTGKVNNTAVAISVNFGSWTIVDLETSGSGNYVSDLFYDSVNGRLWATDSGGNIYSSTNDGTTWTAGTALTGGTSGLNAIASGSTNHAIIGASTGVGAFNYTTNGTSYSSAVLASLGNNLVITAFDPTNSIYGFFTSPVIGTVTNAFGSSSNPFTALPTATYVSALDASFQSNCAIGYAGVFFVAGKITPSGISPKMYSISSTPFTTVNVVTTNFTGATAITGLAVGITAAVAPPTAFYPDSVAKKQLPERSANFSVPFALNFPIKNTVVAPSSIRREGRVDTFPFFPAQKLNFPILPLPYFVDNIRKEGRPDGYIANPAFPLNITVKPRPVFPDSIRKEGRPDGYISTPAFPQKYSVQWIPSYVDAVPVLPRPRHESIFSPSPVTIAVPVIRYNAVYPDSVTPSALSFDNVGGNFSPPPNNAIPRISYNAVYPDSVIPNTLSIPDNVSGVFNIPQVIIPPVPPAPAPSPQQTYWVFPQYKNKHRTLLEKPAKTERDWREIEAERKQLFDEAIKESLGHKIPRKEAEKLEKWKQEQLAKARSIKAETMADMDKAIAQHKRNLLTILLLSEA